MFNQAQLASVSRSGRRVRLVAGCALVLLTSCAQATDPPTAQGNDANTQCAEPALQLEHQLQAALADNSIDASHRQRFLDQVQQCRGVYQVELENLRRDFAELPEDAYCHAVRREFSEALNLFDDIEAKAAEMPLDSEEDRAAAGTFFSLTSPGLVRAVNGLFLLRHGICMEEEIAPFEHPLTDTEISQPNIYLE